uniref:PIH1D1/2/3 CS-like domain-containing protein n=1 Tax=Jaculus jaculus TaxID=51337 RepID=A0A8C5LLL8_JACJA|nr:dynein axonemal assembly factor 6 isoform X1 [Jaculus jaculus]XP_044995755.1 dynein axonemal assembly factor 6 isoform X1 [Jaculus jaculus]
MEFGNAKTENMEAENMKAEKKKPKDMEFETFSTVSAMEALSSLLYPEEEDDFDFKQAQYLSSASPENIGPPTAKEQFKVIPISSGEANDNIWDPDEVLEGAEHEDVWDLRDIPEYEIIFQQKVGTEDIYLGLTSKDPSTACCQEILVKIKLPETNPSELHLDVQERILDLRTPNKRLFVNLPHPVECSSAKACYIPECETLEVTMTLQRGFNFC